MTYYLEGLQQIMYLISFYLIGITWHLDSKINNNEWNVV